MKDEVKSAGDFLAKLLCQSHANLSPEKATTFSHVLQTLLCNHYVNHWFPEKPNKGSAYRCLRINKNNMEPLIRSACQCSGFTESEINCSLPSELTLWIDPKEVSYRIGENGSVCVLYSENGLSMDLSDDGDITDSSSDSSSPGTSPSKSPVNFQPLSPSPSTLHQGSNNNHKRSHRYRNRNKVTNLSNFSGFHQSSTPSPTSAISRNGCTDPWITLEQAHTVHQLSTYVYS